RSLIYTLPLHDALPICRRRLAQHAALESQADRPRPRALLPPATLRAREPDHPLRPDEAALRRLLAATEGPRAHGARAAEEPLHRSEEHTSELQSRENLV